MKFPPTNTVDPDTAIENIGPSGFGAHAASTAPAAVMCARFRTATGPTALKRPPMNQPPFPSAATALTVPATCGNREGSGVPLPVAETIRPPPVGGSCSVNSPPR